MRVVIYDQETYEPLTVVTVPNSFIRDMEDGRAARVYRFAVPPSDIQPYRVDEKPTLGSMKVINVEFEPVAKGNKRIMWLCTAKDWESALMLRSTFLPGQQREVNTIAQNAFINGLLQALA